jgi:hypothetical protein
MRLLGLSSVCKANLLKGAILQSVNLTQVISSFSTNIGKLLYASLTAIFKAYKTIVYLGASHYNCLKIDIISFFY